MVSLHYRLDSLEQFNKLQLHYVEQERYITEP